VHELNDVATTM